ncbi:hypothetical protein LOAG_12925 [Loa loa]|uniref:Uncharacterized protein n=1 Tax=Loa loa TaxID=7209 RepID=A0A1I7W055_LOALO|nr:hypothetical protein LOAG_12925 [Loa loa]EFO15583.2 hypothetical protein LOAG_12925 [Loa loa]
MEQIKPLNLSVLEMSEERNVPIGLSRREIRGRMWLSLVNEASRRYRELMNSINEDEMIGRS